MFNNYPDILTVKQTMKALSLGKNSVYKLLKENLIKSIRFGKKYLIPKTALIEFVKSAV